MFSICVVSIFFEHICLLGDFTNELICHAFAEGMDDRALRDKQHMNDCEKELKLPTAKKFTAAQANMKEPGKDSSQMVHHFLQKSLVRKNIF